MARHSHRKKTSPSTIEYFFERLIIKRTDGLELEVPREECLSVVDVTHLKQVSRTAIYKAILEKRLAAVTVAGHVVIPKIAADSWIPVESEERAGAKRRGGRPRGSKMTEESKARIARTQRLRWADRKRAQSDAVKPPQEDETKAVESQRRSRRRRQPG